MIPLTGMQEVIDIIITFHVKGQLRIGDYTLIDGIVEWKKEIWHTGGYTAERSKAKVLTDSILGRWIGWKVVMYNINNDTAVKMESYIDDKN
jgi:hypothetical protein